MNLTVEDIDWSSPQGVAYQNAKLFPGETQKFQGQEGFRKVYYTNGSSSVEAFGIEFTPATYGYWYEVAVIDVTKVSQDSKVGFRVYDT